MSAALLSAWTKTLRRHGAARAVVQADNGATVTFRELDTRADAWLRTHAPDPAPLRGRAVLFATANSIGWLEIFLGLLKAGAVVVPLDAAEPPAARPEGAPEPGTCGLLSGPCVGTSSAAWSTTWATSGFAGAWPPNWRRGARRCACGSMRPAR